MRHLENAGRVAYFVYLATHQVDEKVHFHFSIRCYEKTWMNFLASTISVSICHLSTSYLPN